MNRFAGRAKARTRHVPGTMNKTEARYADYLALRKLAGEIVAWGFEEVTLKLAKDCRFTPDFWALNCDGDFELIEDYGGLGISDEDMAAMVAEVEAQEMAKIRGELR